MQEGFPQSIFSFSPYLFYFFAILAAFFVSTYVIKNIIRVACHFKIFDVPDDVRKFHGTNIPSLGGVGIFTGYIFVTSLMLLPGFKGWNYLLVSTLALFFVGVYDDLMNLKPLLKLITQLIASFITIYLLDIKFIFFNDVVGIEQLIFVSNIFATTLVCTFFINVFNFIDGIDGLACIVGSYYLLVLGAMLLISREYNGATISFCLLGATLGLLVYNREPAKIYMGDTGSMLLGFSIFVLALFILKQNKENFLNTDFAQIFSIKKASGLFIIISSLIFFPIFDAIRVFTLRISKGKSPLVADRLHMHYHLIDQGFSHQTSVYILFAVNVLLFGSGIILRNYNVFTAILVNIGIVSIFTNSILYRRRKRLKI